MLELVAGNGYHITEIQVHTAYMYVLCRALVHYVSYIGQAGFHLGFSSRGVANAMIAKLRGGKNYRNASSSFSLARNIIIPYGGKFSRG